MINIPKKDIVWKLVNYLRRGEDFEYDYHLWLNEPLASWDVYDYWERVRVESMQKNLKKGDILFDIGTEQGWCNLAYAHIVGPENMVLIEPTPEFWPNIEALWSKNFPNVKPLSCYAGLFSDKTTGDSVDVINPDRTFPPQADGDLIDRNSYKYIHEHGDVIPQIRIDDFCKFSGTIPDALTIDTEGSELLILKGAENLLKTYLPKLWISVHNDMALQNYGIKEGELAEYLKSLGYVGEFLGEDHEQHVYFHI